MHEDDLEGVVRDLKGMSERFQGQGSAAAPCLDSTDRAGFKRLMLETKGMLSADLGPLNDFAVPLLQMTNLPGYGMLNPPTPEQLQEALALVEGGLNQVRRKQNRPAVLKSTQRPPYVAPVRIAELQALQDPTWDPRRLIRMLQELNLAHANDMNMATAMLLRAVTDHVPPIFGKAAFAQVAAQHTAGPGEGRSFKGAMAPLAESMKHIADGLLHVHIRPTETTPSTTQVDYRQSLDVLLGEVVRLLRARPAH